jgi:hypothetical protein
MLGGFLQVEMHKVAPENRVTGAASEREGRLGLAASRALLEPPAATPLFSTH